MYGLRRLCESLRFSVTPETYLNRGSTRRFLLVHLVPALVVVAALILMELTPLDRLISDRFFDTASRTFPLRHDFWFDVVLYHWVKYVVIGIAIIVLVTWLLSFSARGLKQWRRLLLFLTLGMWLAPGVAVALKYSNYRSCPWDLDIYGRSAPYLSLVEAFTSPFPAGIAHTHCFPAGHAAAGFCLLVIYFAGRALNRPRLASAGLWIGISAGLILGLGRIAQGAHFLSHNLWTGVICWTVMVLLYVVIFERRSEAAYQPRVRQRDPAFQRPASADRVAKA